MGGIIGALLAAFLTEYMSPRISFGICSFMGLLIASLGMRMNKSVEGASLDVVSNRTFRQELGHNFK